MPRYAVEMCLKRLTHSGHLIVSRVRVLSPMSSGWEAVVPRFALHDFEIVHLFGVDSVPVLFQQCDHQVSRVVALLQRDVLLLGSGTTVLKPYVNLAVRGAFMVRHSLLVCGAWVCVQLEVVFKQRPTTSSQCRWRRAVVGGRRLGLVCRPIIYDGVRPYCQLV